MLREITKQVPSLMCMVIIVFLFLSYLEKERSHIDALNIKTSNVIDENTKAVRENTEVLGEVREALHDFKNFQKFKFSSPS